MMYFTLTPFPTGLIERSQDYVVPVCKLLPKNIGCRETTRHSQEGYIVPQRVNVRALGNTGSLPSVVEGALQAPPGDRPARMFHARRREQPLGGVVRFPKLA